MLFWILTFDILFNIARDAVKGGGQKWQAEKRMKHHLLVRN